MTRRILLTLADDTTATECGACVMLSSVRADDPRLVEWACNAFPDSPDSMGLVDTAARRLPECIAAEAAAKQDDSDRQLGELARASLHLCVVRMEKGDAWPTAELAAYGPTAAAFIDALRKAQK